MRYGQIAGVGKPISRIVYGCASEAMLRGEDLRATLDEALACSVTAFDTARVYQQSERVLGDWLRGQKRDELVIITKGCHPDDETPNRVNERCLRDDLRRSLSELRTDYIDVYLLHRDDLGVPVGAMVEALNARREAGEIRAFGASNWTAARIAQANEYARTHGLTPFAVSSPQLSLAVQVADPYGGGAGCVSLTGGAMADERAWYRQTDLPVLAYSCLARGMLSGKLRSADASRAEQVLDPFSVKGFLCQENVERLRRAEALAREKGCTVAQLAVAWALGQALNVFAILTSASPERLRANAGGVDVAVSAEEAAWLNLEA